MRKYDSYKDSGIEWIGEIPSHWDTARMKFHLDYQKGKNPKELKFSENENSEVYLAMDYLRGNPKQMLYVEDVENYILVHDNEILLLWDGSNAGEFVLSKKGILSSTMAILSLNNIQKDFSWYFLKHFEPQLKESTIGMGVPHVNGEELKNAFLVAPTPEEQTAIAAYLDRKTAEIDELIADKKRLLELYEEEKAAIINQAVTKGINPDAPMKDSGIEWLGEIPEHWETSPLKYLGKFINGFSFKSTDFETTGVRVLKISNIQHMRIDWSDESFIDEIFYETHENFRVLENDLVFALTRPIISTGIKVALIDTTEPILLNQRNSIYRPTDINVKWFYYIILSSNFIQEFDSRIDKTGQQPNISSNDIGEIKITIPNEDEQYEIISFIDAVCSEIENKRVKTQKLIDLLTEYRTALISEVVTGKIKVIE